MILFFYFSNLVCKITPSPRLPEEVMITVLSFLNIMELFIIYKKIKAKIETDGGFLRKTLQTAIRRRKEIQFPTFLKHQDFIDIFGINDSVNNIRDKEFIFENFNNVIRGERNFENLAISSLYVTEMDTIGLKLNEEELKRLTVVDTVHYGYIPDIIKNLINLSELNLYRVLVDIRVNTFSKLKLKKLIVQDTWCVDSKEFHKAILSQSEYLESLTLRNNKEFGLRRMEHLERLENKEFINLTYGYFEIHDVLNVSTFQFLKKQRKLNVLIIAVYHLSMFTELNIIQFVSKIDIHMCLETFAINLVDPSDPYSARKIRRTVGQSKRDPSKTYRILMSGEPLEVRNFFTRITNYNWAFLQVLQHLNHE